MTQPHYIMPPKPDLKLVNGLASGSKEAFNEIYATYSEPIYRFCYRMVGNAADAEDATAETFAAVLQHASNIHKGDSFRIWIYRLARSKGIGIIRKRNVLERDKLDELEEIAAPSMKEVPQEVDSVRQAMATLDVEHREVLILIDVEGMTAKEAGTLLGISDSWAKQRLFLARRALRDALTG